MSYTFSAFRQYLEEKLIILGGDKKYDQVCIVAGGAGSGKGFTISNMIGASSYKVLNPDDIKEMLLKLAKNVAKIEKNPKATELSKKRVDRIKNTLIPAPLPDDMMHNSMHKKDGSAERRAGRGSLSNILSHIRKYDLHNPNNVTDLHNLVWDMNSAEKQMALMFSELGGTRTHLPNILFDRTVSSPAALAESTKLALELGYKANNIHFVWVLTGYEVALKQNSGRSRNVLNDVVFGTHSGAKRTMVDYLFKDYENYKINGDVAVVLGGRPKEYEIGGEKVKVGASTIQSKNADIAGRGISGKLMPFVSRTKDPAKLAAHEKNRNQVVLDFKYFRLKKAGVAGLDKDVVASVIAYANALAPQGTEIDPQVAIDYPATSKNFQDYLDAQKAAKK
jgi:hypothetical protein